MLAGLLQGTVAGPHTVSVAFDVAASTVVVAPQSLCLTSGVVALGSDSTAEKHLGNDAGPVDESLRKVSAGIQPCRDPHEDACDAEPHAEDPGCGGLHAEPLDCGVAGVVLAGCSRTLLATGYPSYLDHDFPSHPGQATFAVGHPSHSAMADGVLHAAVANAAARAIVHLSVAKTGDLAKIGLQLLASPVLDTGRLDVAGGKEEIFPHPKNFPLAAAHEELAAAEHHVVDAVD